MKKTLFWQELIWLIIYILTLVTVTIIWVCGNRADADTPDISEAPIPTTEVMINIPLKPEPIEILVQTPVDIPEKIEEPVEELVMYYDVPLSEGLQDHIFALCEDYRINPAIVIAIIEKESNYRDWVKGDSGRSYGLMQIQKRWHVERMNKLGCDNLLDPYQNVTVGIDILAELLYRNNDIEWALMAYNGGASYANKLASQGIVSKYAQKVLEISRGLEKVVG